MIDVRLEFTANEGIWITGPIHNERALDALLVTRKRLPSDHMQVHDDADHRAIADAALEIARRERTMSLLTWGNGRFCCEIAPLPGATGELCTPRELRGPLIEEVAEHTPLIMAYDHGGGRREITHAEAQRRRGGAGNSPDDKAALPRASAPPRGALGPPRETFWIERPFPRWAVWIRDLLDFVLLVLLGGREYVPRDVPQGKESTSDQ